MREASPLLEQCVCQNIFCRGFLFIVSMLFLCNDILSGPRKALFSCTSSAVSAKVAKFVPMNKASTNLCLFGVVAAYAILAALYFCPISLPYQLVYPVAFLALAAPAMLTWDIAAAFALCAIGDFMGLRNDFLLQMGFFAAGHTMFIVYFLRHWDARNSKPLRAGLALAVLATLVCAAIAILARVPAGILRAGTIIYALLILTMMYMACCQRCLLCGIGAALFVASDAVLAYNKFVSAIPMAGMLIMSTYYAAQILLFAGALQTKSRSAQKTQQP